MLVLSVRSHALCQKIILRIVIRRSLPQHWGVSSLSLSSRYGIHCNRFACPACIVPLFFLSKCYLLMTAALPSDACIFYRGLRSLTCMRHLRREPAVELRNDYFPSSLLILQSYIALASFLLSCLPLPLFLRSFTSRAEQPTSTQLR